jgi:methylated-DNA-[protein]-cysteine S-methyltransferase
MPEKKTLNFNERVWAAMRLIPRGRVTTYGAIARYLKNPQAMRAVGQACNRNPDAPRTPCHRVISSNGKLGGYAFGLEKKKELLRTEGVRWGANEVIDLEKFGFEFKKAK